jgi:hypothetical protein
MDPTRLRRLFDAVTKLESGGAALVNIVDAREAEKLGLVQYVQDKNTFKLTKSGREKFAQITKS